jgi:hypothetical protein
MSHETAARMYSADDTVPTIVLPVRIRISIWCRGSRGSFTLCETNVASSGDKTKGGRPRA